jgi:chaperonin GroES
MKQQLRPLFDQIVVRELDPPEVRNSGLLVPIGSSETPNPQEGIVIATGEGQDWWQHVGFEMPVKPGDHVMFPFHAGSYVLVDEEKLLVIRVGQLLGVVEDVPGGPAAFDAERRALEES